MDSNNDMLLKIKDLQAKKKLTQTNFSKKLGVPQATLNRIITGANPVTLNLLNAIKQAYDIPISYFVGESGNANSVPLLSNQAAAGFFLGLGDTEVSDRVSIPNVSGLDWVALGVQGASMHPTIAEGDLLVCRKIQGMDNFVSGRVYVCILANDTIAVKRVYFKNDAFNLVSDNIAVKPVQIQAAEMLQIWAVKYRITDHLRPEQIEELYPV